MMDAVPIPVLAGVGSGYLALSANHNQLITERGWYYDCSANLTLSLLSAATAGASFAQIINVQDGVRVTVAANGTDTISGVGSITCNRGLYHLECAGSGTWRLRAVSTQPFYNVMDYGAFGDGNTHPVNTVYGSLAAAQAAFPSCTSTDYTNGVECDGLAIQTAINAAATAFPVGTNPNNGFARSTVLLPPGTYWISKTISLAQFVNMTGFRATTADTSTTQGSAANSRGTVLRGLPAIYTNNNATAGVVLYLSTGDIDLECMTICGTAAINGNPSIGLQLASSAASGIGSRPFETQAPQICSGLRFYDVTFYTCSEAIEANWVGDTYTYGLRFESNTTDILQNRRDCAIVFEGATFFGFTNHLADTANSGNTFVSYHGCTWQSTVVSSETWLFTNAHNVDIDVHGGQIQAKSRLLDCRVNIDANYCRMRFIGCWFDGSQGGTINIARGGATVLDYLIGFTDCNFESCNITLNIAGSVRFIGNNFNNTLINGLTSNPNITIVGNRFQNITGSAPITIPSNSPGLTLVGNVFNSCNTALSLANHPTNNYWRVIANSNDQAPMADFRYDGQVEETYGTAAPASGTWNQGSICWNTSGSAATSNLGWYCEASGTPGTWVAFGNLAQLAAPPPIGSTTPNTGAFTTLTSSSTARFNGASVGVVGIASASETNPTGIGAWDNGKHVILAGAANTSTVAALAAMLNQATAAAYLLALQPGTAWRDFNIIANTFHFNPAGNGNALSVSSAGVVNVGGDVQPGTSFPGNIVWGVRNAAADTAGQVGETIQSSVSAVAAGATGVTANVTSISLTAGKWLLEGFIVAHGGATGLTSGSAIKTSIVTTSASDGTSGSTMAQMSVLALLANGLFSQSVNGVVVNISATTTYFLTANLTYAAGSPTLDGTLTATRIR